MSVDLTNYLHVSPFHYSQYHLYCRNGQISAATTGRIYISKDRGVNWEKADKGFPEDATVNPWIVQDRKVIAEQMLMEFLFPTIV